MRLAENRIRHLAGPAATLAVTDPDGRVKTFSHTRSDIKERIWNLLMPRIDPSAAARLSRSTLTSEIAKLVQEIATEERIEGGVERRTS